MKIGRASSPASTDSTRADSASTASGVRLAEAKDAMATAPVATSATQAASVGRGVRLAEAKDSMAQTLATAAADNATVDASRACTAGVDLAARARILKAGELADAVTRPARGLDVDLYRKRGSGKEM